MIDLIMTQINNHFARSVESQTYEIVADGIQGSFSEKYVVGQYIWIRHSFINDGVYKISAVSSTKLTVEETLTAENTGETIEVYGLVPPKAFLNLVSDIETYVNAQSVTALGVKSESQGNRSVSYGSGASGSGGNAWQSVFSQSLNQYRRMFDDDESVRLGQRNWQNRMGCY